MESSLISVDVFLIAGQSNAVGEGDKNVSPAVNSETILQVYNKTISPAADPVGNALTGSAWPAFGNEYNRICGRRIAFVPAAVGGSGLSPYADVGTGHWAARTFMGQIDLLGMAVDQTRDALALLSASGYTPTLKGILWSQGENEAVRISSGIDLAQADYEAMLSNVIARFRGNLGSDLPFYIFQTGTDTRTDAQGKIMFPDDPGYARIRAAQEHIAQNLPHTKIVFSGAVGFAKRGMLKDGIHYTQDGYNEMGLIGARGVLE